MAALINLNGDLCARVIFVGPELDSGERQVNGDEYSNSKNAGTKNNMAVYMVNMRSGTVRRVGRG